MGSNNISSFFTTHVIQTHLDILVIQVHLDIQVTHKSFDIASSSITEITLKSTLTDWLIIFEALDHSQVD